MLVIKEKIEQGLTSLGIELGSTRIKAVLIDDDFQTIAQGNFEWENQLIDGYWTYSLEDVWTGIQISYQEMAREVKEKYGVVLERIGAIGFSAMMHGYMAFDQRDQLLVPFRTWRNATTSQAAQELTQLFNYNIPERWSIAHLYQAMLNQESHIQDVTFLTTLAGYVHWQLTGEKVLGIGDASGMFPIDPAIKHYHQSMVAKFDEKRSADQLPWTLSEVLPQVVLAGENAGFLTEAGAKRLDISGHLKAGIPFCAPEGDAGTGMTATNSVGKRTGNVSAGTSAFAMIVLEQELKAVYPEIDLVTTPTGSLVAMVHTNNCSSEINAWMKLFKQVSDVIGAEISTNQLFEKLFSQALLGEVDCGGLLSYGYHSGENITKVPEGRPLFVRTPESQFNLANVMRMHLYSAFGALNIGMTILNQENVQVDKIVGHGGIFKTPVVAQQFLAAAMQAPVTVMSTAGEGGAWGIALLAAFTRIRNPDQPLSDFLNQQVFGNIKSTTIDPIERDVAGFERFIARYQKGLPIELSAIDHLAAL